LLVFKFGKYVFTKQEHGQLSRTIVSFFRFGGVGFAKILTFAAIFINGSFTFYAQQKVSPDKSYASGLRFSAGRS
jgi:hypothetical protein